ncbi:MAG: hypothetical protein LLG05_09585 [Porphyromonadaceae bacterium]|nr:hypothetical protein [Porphyromonadaceae bacterium]
MSSGLGPDIKEVYDELGVDITIINRDNITEEKILYDINSQATKPFIREHHLDCTFHYLTNLNVGDVFQVTETELCYMVMNKTPELFENNTVEYNGIIYLCNIPTTAHILRPIEQRDLTSYDMINGWTVLENAPVYGVLSDRVFGSQIEEGQLIQGGQTQVWRIDCYLPKWYDVKPLDRLVISPTEYYKIESIQSYYYPGAIVALLTEDTRPAPTMDGDEVYDD